MKKVMWILGTCLVMTSVACMILAYLWIDRSISLTFARQSAEVTNRSVRSLQRALEEEWHGMPQIQVLLKLKEIESQNPQLGIIVKEEQDIIWLDEVPFKFDSGQLSSIGEKK